MRHLILCLLACFSVNLWANDNHVITVGVVPQQSATKLARLWSPILAEIAQSTGHQLKFETAKDIPTFEQRLSEGKYDLAYMNPYHYTVFHEKPGYIAFAKEKDKFIQGVIVVRKDSPLQKIEELKGKTIAFPAPAAFAATILPQAYFKKHDFNITPQYVSSHDSVYYAVARGLLPAGGGVRRTFSNTKSEILEQLRVLWTTDKYTPHAFAYHPRVPKVVIEQIAKALFAMDQKPETLELLKALDFKGIEAAKNSDWDDVRALDIHLLSNMAQ